MPTPINQEQTESSITISINKCKNKIQDLKKSFLPKCK